MGLPEPVATTVDNPSLAENVLKDAPILRLSKMIRTTSGGIENKTRAHGIVAKLMHGFAPAVEAEQYGPGNFVAYSVPGSYI